MKIIILDRDGVINLEQASHILHPKDWHAVPGSLEAIANLHQAGFHIIVATNQSPIGRGWINRSELQKIHDKMLSDIRAAGGDLMGLFYCPHAPDAGCHCRKPNPGLFEQIEQAYDINLKNIPFVGDALTDIEVAQRVGCEPILVKSGKGLKTLEKLPDNHTIKTFENLLDYSKYLLGQ